MRVVIQESMPSRMVYIYIFEDSNRFIYQYTGEASLGFENYEPGTEPPNPTLRLPLEVWDAIVAEFVSIPSEDALKDARQIRDRLLVMIESEWHSRQLEAK